MMCCTNRCSFYFTFTLCVVHIDMPCKNSLTDLDAVLGAGLTDMGPRNYVSTQWYRKLIR